MTLNLGWILNPMISVLIRERRRGHEVQRQRGESHVTVEAEIRMIYL
jgi:hypothetical protein